MPQLNPLVLTDGAATHTFNPRDIVGGVSTLVESTGVPIGDRRVSISSSRTTTGRVKVSVKFTIPEVQDVVVAGVSRPTVVRTAYADLALTFDSTSNATERTKMQNLLESFFGTTMADAVIRDLESLY